MRIPARSILILMALCCATVRVSAQTAPTAQPTGAISGRITIGDKPAQGVTVAATPANNYQPQRKAATRATTDADGQFQLTNLAAGQYEIVPLAPALVALERTPGFNDHNKRVNLAAGETVGQINFSLVRGGVITGRVTNADGRPVIGEPLRLALAGQSNDRRGPGYNQGRFETDDRGIYRLYGILPGRYLVSVGEDGKSGMTRMGTGRSGFYPQAFHPGVADESKATVVEVTEGSEATNVDITLGSRAETFIASGSIVDAETGKPVPNVVAACGSLPPGEKQMNSFGLIGRSDAEGRFRCEGLLPGHYAAFFASPSEGSDSYSVPVPFEISESDVTGLVIKVRRGASISGVAVIEGVSERSILAKLSQLRISHWPETESLAAPNFGGGGKINADGSFRIGGLRPGKFRLVLGGWPPPPKGLSLLRVEREGVEQSMGLIDVPANGQVTGVRFVLQYGDGIVRGQVRVENGPLPEGTLLYISARRPSAAESNLPGTYVDARGHFVIEGLPPGDYQLRLNAHAPGQSRRQIRPVVQNVSVTKGTDISVTMAIDLNAESGVNEP